MGKRSVRVRPYEKSKNSHKTKKRLEIKRLMLENKTSKKKQK